MFGNKENLPVVFISSALTPDEAENSKVLEYFVNIVVHLSVLLRKEGFDLILMVPKSQEEAAKNQKEFLDVLYEDTHLEGHCSGVIITPFDLVEIESILGKLIFRYQEKIFPILTIDKGYENIRPEKGLKSPPPYVMCNQKLGGEKAAESLISYFKHNQKYIEKSPHVATMAGLRDHKGKIDRYSNERIEAFEGKLKKELPKTIICTEKPLMGDFNRSKAKQEAQKFIQKNEREKIPHAFFCCNDEMALGVRDAIIEEKQKILEEYQSIPVKGAKKKEQVKEQVYDQLTWINNIKIVGFDYIREVSTLLDDGDNWLLNSVNIVIHKQVTELVKIFVALKHKKQVSQGIKYPPVLGIKLLKQNNKYNWHQK